MSAGKERLDTALANFASLYGGLLDFYDRQVRAPFTLEHFTMVIAALSEGFVLQGLSGVEHPLIEREITEPGVGADWTLLASAVEATIVEAFTEPVPGQQA